MGLLAGVMQVNLLIPTEITPGNFVRSPCKWETVATQAGVDPSGNELTGAGWRRAPIQTPERAPARPGRSSLGAAWEWRTGAGPRHREGGRRAGESQGGFHTPPFGQRHRQRSVEGVSRGGGRREPPRRTQARGSAGGRPRRSSPGRQLEDHCARTHAQQVARHVSRFGQCHARGRGRPSNWSASLSWGQDVHALEQGRVERLRGGGIEDWSRAPLRAPERGPPPPYRAGSPVGTMHGSRRGKPGAFASTSAAASA